MSIRNINPAYGDAIVMRNPAEMARLIQKCGYDLPEDGLKEGRDYEELSIDELLALAKSRARYNMDLVHDFAQRQKGYDMYFSYHLTALEDAIHGPQY